MGAYSFGVGSDRVRSPYVRRILLGEVIERRKSAACRYLAVLLVGMWSGWGAAQAGSSSPQEMVSSPQVDASELVSMITARARARFNEEVENGH